MCIYLFKKKDDIIDQKQVFGLERCVCYLIFHQNMIMKKGINLYIHYFHESSKPSDHSWWKENSTGHFAPKWPNMSGHVRGQIPLGRHPSQNCQLRHTSCAVIHMSRSSALKLKREQIRGHMPFGWQSSQNHEDGGGENPSQSQPSS